MTDLDKWFGWFVFVVFVVFISWMVFVIIPDSMKRTQECQEKSGVMVRSPSGWVCIDAQRLK